MELPLLRIGLLGFGRSDANLATAQILSAATSRSRWEVVPFEDADLWLIHSPSVSMGENRGLHIANPDAPHSPLTIYPHQTSRPVAFTMPLPGAIDAVLAVDLTNTYQCASGLNQFATALPLQCAHFALGEQVASRQSNLRKGTYHLQFEGRMVAVVDLVAWRVGLAPDAKPIQLSLASWRHRPTDAAHMPQGFTVQTLEKPMWAYASRTTKAQLPSSYATELIYLRRLSVLPQSWLHQDHMNLIGMLSRQPMLLTELSRQTQLPAERLAACLAALYYIGTVTTDPRQILQGDKRVRSSYAALAASATADAQGELSVSDFDQISSQSVFDTHSFAPASSHHA